eukprot:jgi/Chrpa1/26156/Chrysochromulina_OHIO_Genome00021762-RA
MDALLPIGRLNGSPQAWVSTSGAAAALRSQLEVQRESLEPVERRTYAEAEGLPKEGLDRTRVEAMAKALREQERASASEAQSHAYRVRGELAGRGARVHAEAEALLRDEAEEAAYGACQ